MIIYLFFCLFVWYNNIKGGKRLIIEKDISEPSNLRWENLDASSWDIMRRKGFVAILIICLMFLTFSIVFVANIMKPKNTINCPS